MKNHLAIKALKFFLFITPFLLGFAGYLPLYNYDCFWAAYSAVRLYILEIDLAEINFLEVQNKKPKSG